MNFKEQLKNDLNIFINPNEFGESHVIDNKKINVVIDYDMLKERSKKEYDGISVGELLYFVNAEDFGQLPSEDSPQIFDGRIMYVFSAREESGIYEIILKQNIGE